MEISNIISVEKIKPSSPTPPHLRVYNISLLDRIMAAIYIPVVLYYLGNDSSDKIQHLKESLSRTLVTFYPFAGIIRDALSADCNDQGLPFSVAKVNARLSDFLQNPNVELINKLFPGDEKNPVAGDSVMLIQLNCFACGSIAICIKFHHVIADIVSISTFLQCWAANAQGLGFAPLNHIAQSSFPQNPSIPNNLLPFSYISKLMSAGKFVVRRYVFDASALSILKAQMSSPSSTVSRVNVVTAVICKCFLEAVAAEKDVKPVLMTQAVNLRRKATPPFPDDSFGNLVWSTVGLWSNPEEKELTEVVTEVKKGIAKIDGEFVRRLGSDGVYEFLEELRNEFPQEATWLAFTSWANIGLSEVNFGWGKPVWMSGCIPQYSEFETLVGGNFFNLLDSKSGGIEAWAILNKKYVAGFEKNDHIRKYAHFNPSVI